MYKGKTIVAVIPARGGSKGLPHKNLRRVGDETLVKLATICAHAVPEIDLVICSTDDWDIACQAAPSEIVFRPESLSGDNVGDAEVLRHADNVHDVIVMLQPTCPTRKPSEVIECIRTLIDEEYDSIWTVTLTDLHYHPDKQLYIKDGMLVGKSEIRRQDLEQTYTRNGACYAMTRECLEKYGTMGPNCGAIITEPHVSIDTMEDLHAAQAGIVSQSDIY